MRSRHRPARGVMLAVLWLPLAAGCEGQVIRFGCELGEARCVEAQLYLCGEEGWSATACDDGDRCNGREGCADGRCQPGEPVVCADDANPCTSEICDPARGCNWADDEANCQDEDACNGIETCVDGVCRAGPPLICADDANPCTRDVCDPVRRCNWPDDSLSCQDEDGCNGIEICVAGVCRAGEPWVCEDDGNPCTSEICDPLLRCNWPVDGASCDDANPCTGAGTCGGGTCQPGPPVACVDDANPCTHDSCDAEWGCNWPDDTLRCDDCPGCDPTGRCVNGTCLVGQPCIPAPLPPPPACGPGLDPCLPTQLCDGSQCQLHVCAAITSPALVTSFYHEGYMTEMALVGDFVFVGIEDDGLVVIDVSDPADPFIAGSYAPSGSGQVYGVTIDDSGTRAFASIGAISSNLRRLDVLDIANPTSPLLMGSASDVAVGPLDWELDTLYATQSGGVSLIDTAAGDVPVEVGNFTLSGVNEVAVRNGCIYATDNHGINPGGGGPGGLTVLDATDPGDILVLGSLDTPGDPRDVWVEGSLVYVADGIDSALQIVDVADPNAPTLVGGLTPETGNGLAKAGSYVLIASAYAGLLVVDVSDPANPDHVATVDTYFLARVVVKHNYAFAIGGGNFYVFELCTL